MLRGPSPARDPAPPRLASYALPRGVPALQDPPGRRPLVLAVVLVWGIAAGLGLAALIRLTA